MKQQLTNEKVFNVAIVLKSNYTELSKYDKRFNFAVTRTLSNIQPIAADLVKARESGIERFKEFEEKREAILKSHTELDAQGNILKDEKGLNLFKSSEEREIGQEELNDLADEYKDALEEREKEIKIFNEILDEEVEVDIIQCKFEALPDDFDFENLRVLVKETDEEIEAMI